MLTRKALDKKIQSFIKDLQANGFQPSRAVLFGSYAKGNPHEYSDVDLAIWDKKFSGVGALDFEKIAPIARNYVGIEVHFYQEGETEDDDPFIEEINKTGIEILIPA